MIALHASYYDDNFGDLLLVKIFEKWIKENTDSDIVYPLVPKMEQKRFQKHFPESIIGLKNQNSWKAMVYAGGGHFGEPDSRSASWNKRFFVRHVLPAEIGILRKIPYVILGVGVGPLSNFFVRQEVKRLFAHAKALTVRDEESRDYVLDILRICPQVKMVPDPALTISRSDIPFKAFGRVDPIFELFQDKILLGIHHPYRILSETPQAEIFRESLMSSLKASPDVLPVVFTDSDAGQNALYCEKLKSAIEEATNNKCLAIPFQGIWETVALISKLSIVLTTKLHVGIVAYALGVYGESFATHSKTSRFYRQIGHPHQCTMFDEMTEEVAFKRITRAIAFARSRGSIMDQAWQKVKEEAHLNHKYVREFLKSGSATN